MKSRTSKRHVSKPRVPPIVYILLGLLVVWGCLQLSSLKWISPPDSQGQLSPLTTRMSWGGASLFSGAGPSQKQQGITAFAQKDYSRAVQAFQGYLTVTPNDPEARIFLNNAQAASAPTLKLAVVVPIGSNPNVAQEILRGVAQAQDEFNRQGGMKGFKLQILIVNDDNDPKLAEQLATSLTQTQDILAVIGHNASNASLAAAPIYQQAGLVMVTPTSFANRLSNYGSHIFRVVPNTKAIAIPLAQHAFQSKGVKRIAICYDSQSPDNSSFRDEFMVAYAQLGGQIAPVVCDLSLPNFDATTTLSDIVNSQAQGILLSPHIDRMSRATTLINENQKRLPLFSTPTMYTIQTLQESGQNAEGLILSIPWFPTQPFASNAERLWRGPINWRTANSYDATQVIIAGLRDEQTRSSLQRTIRRQGFAAPGASGDVRFLPTGDRDSSGLLAQVTATADNRFRFELLRP
jgi:branched-chain amino acid transport system substrate-binding protein